MTLRFSTSDQNVSALQVSFAVGQMSGMVGARNELHASVVQIRIINRQPDRHSM